MYALPSVRAMPVTITLVEAGQRVAFAAGATAVVVAAFASFLTVTLTGGSPNALNNLGYVPILLAAYRFGWRGAALTALMVGFLHGPAASLLHLPAGEGQEAWLIRWFAFLGIGVTVGLLFDRLRSAVTGWRTEVARVEAREHEAIVAFARGSEAKDGDTGRHVVRVEITSRELARATGMTVEDASRIGWAALLHDIGKLHVPDRILTKPGPLDADEWAIMRRHPIWGEEILTDGDGFSIARRVARWHHENFDGSGYPDGLAGETIPLEARIVRVADAFDAMTNVRSYAPARTVEEALEELDRWAGRQFDPDLTGLMIGLLRSDPGLRDQLARVTVGARCRTLSMGALGRPD